MDTENNPFKAPEARVADASPAKSEEYIQGGRRVAAGNGLRWIKGGCAILWSTPGAWVGLVMLFAAIAGMLAEVNFFVGFPLFALVLPTLIGGIMIGCRDQEAGESLRIGHIFTSLSKYIGKLALLGLLNLASLFSTFMIFSLIVVIGVGGKGTPATGSVATSTALAILLFAPQAMAIWQAPALVVFHENSPFQAMKLSFSACLKNFMAVLICIVLIIAIAIFIGVPVSMALWWSARALATSIPIKLPVFFGWLVLLPIVFTSAYAGYRDIFTDNP